MLKGAKKENNPWDSNVVPHRSTNQARTCLTSLSRREAVLSCWYGRSHCEMQKQLVLNILLESCRKYMTKKAVTTKVKTP